jgi:hypothetical protein
MGKQHYDEINKHKSKNKPKNKYNQQNNHIIIDTTQNQSLPSPQLSSMSISSSNTVTPSQYSLQGQQKQTTTPTTTTRQLNPSKQQQLRQLDQSPTRSLQSSSQRAQSQKSNFIPNFSPKKLFILGGGIVLKKINHDRTLEKKNKRPQINASTAIIPTKTQYRRVVLVVRRRVRVNGDDLTSFSTQDQQPSQPNTPKQE